MGERDQILDELLAQEPSKDAWSSIVACLSDWPRDDAGRAVALQRAAGRLAAWPAKQCIAALSSNIYLGSKLTHPAPSLVRFVHWQVDSDGFNFKAAPRVLAPFTAAESVDILVTDTDCSLKWLKHLRDEGLKHCAEVVGRSASLQEMELWVVGYHIGPEERRESLAERWERGRGWKTLYEPWESIVARHGGL